MKKQFLNLFQFGWLAVALLTLGTFSSCVGDEDEPDPVIPIPSFQYTIDESNFLQVTFSNFSQNAVSFEWNFGDGNTSTSAELEVVHTYAETGTYTVSLTATAEDGTPSAAPFEETITISDPDAQLTLLAGTISKEWIPQREGVIATVGPNGAYDGTWWSFGGVTPLAERPCILDDVYTFYRDGKFDLNSNGTFFMDSEANGGWNNDLGEGCADESNPLALVSSTGNDYSAFASGGDYTYAYDAAANKLTLNGQGTYMMLPKVQDGADIGPNAGSLPNSVTYDVIKLVDGPVADSLHLLINGVWTFLFVSYDNPADIPDMPILLPNAAFTYQADKLVVSFTNTSNDAAINFAWDFGDGNTSTDASPTHTYAAGGTYTVSLTTNDGNGNTATESKDITVSATGLTTPAPTPTRAAANVISIYSDTYGNVAGLDVNPGWGQATITQEITIVEGDKAIQMTGLNYQGMDWNANPQDVSGKTHVHIDVWAAEAVSFQFFLIAADGGGETPTTVTAVAGEWTGFDIPLTEYNSIPLDKIFQFKFDNKGGEFGSPSFYVDNIYFYNE